MKQNQFRGRKITNKNDFINNIIVGNSEIPFECNTIRVEYLTKTRTCILFHQDFIMDAFFFFFFKCDLHFCFTSS